MKFKLIYIIILSYLFLISCSSIKSAGKILRNEKETSTDEFLIEKNNPLTVPPNALKLPEPNSEEDLKKTESLEIEKILNEKVEIKKEKQSELEKLILDEIKK